MQQWLHECASVLRYTCLVAVLDCALICSLCLYLKLDSLRYTRRGGFGLLHKQVASRVVLAVSEAVNLSLTQDVNKFFLWFPPLSYLSFRIRGCYWLKLCKSMLTDSLREWDCQKYGTTSTSTYIDGVLVSQRVKIFSAFYATPVVY